MTSAAPQSTVYKAVSDQDGRTYSLRRIHDCHLLRDSPSSQAVSSLKGKWSRINNSSVVTSHLAFSTQAFGDTSVIIVSDFFPDSTTLRERHLPSQLRLPSRAYTPPIPEQTLWSYILQMANALKAIHSIGLAARSMDSKRWLLIDEDRIRFNACGLADITDPNTTPLHELQRQDLQKVGDIIFSIATTSAATHSKSRPTEHFTRSYSPRLRHAVDWLQNQAAPTESADMIDAFLTLIGPDVIDTCNSSLHLNDHLTFHLGRELENSRLVRLLFKLNAINDRPEYADDPAWRDQGQRAAISLFRDYVFHQVDAAGQPVVDMGHMLGCLNKLDVGVEERMMLVSRNEATVMVVTFREMKSAVEGAWAELMKRSSGG